MGKKEQVPALAIFVQGSLWVWSATSRGRPPDGGLALAVFHIVPRVPAAPNLFVHPPAEYLSAKRVWTLETFTSYRALPYLFFLCGIAYTRNTPSVL